MGVGGSRRLSERGICLRGGLPAGSAEREAATDKEPAVVGDRRVPRLLHHTHKKYIARNREGDW
jgi:hypothetical protein